MPKKEKPTPSTEVTILDRLDLAPKASAAVGKFAKAVKPAGVVKWCDQGELLQAKGFAFQLLAGIALCGIKAECRHGEYQDKLLEIKNRLKGSKWNSGST